MGNNNQPRKMFENLRSITMEKTETFFSKEEDNNDFTRSKTEMTTGM